MDVEVAAGVTVTGDGIVGVDSANGGLQAESNAMSTTRKSCFIIPMIFLKNFR